MLRVTPKAIALLVVPLTAAIVLAVALWLRDDGAAAEVRRRERAELEALVDAEKRARSGDPASALRKLRASPGTDAQASRAEMLRHGERGVPALKAAVRDPREPSAFRLECLALLSDLNKPSADAEVLDILADRSFAEPFRALALGKLIGRPLEAAFPVLRRIFVEEPGFGQRILLIKALGESRLPGATPLLVDAARTEKTPGARAQAVESLGSRTADPEVLRGVREIAAGAPEENVRLAAIAALGRSAAPSIDAFLKELSADASQPSGVRKAAESWLERRARR